MEEKDLLNPPCKRTYFLDYLGKTSVHRVYSHSMSRWVVARRKFLRKSMFCALTIDQHGVSTAKEEKALISFNDPSSNLSSQETVSGATVVTAKPVIAHPLAPTESCSSSSASESGDNDLPCTVNFANIVDIIAPTDHEKRCFSFIIDSGQNNPFTVYVYGDKDAVMIEEIADTLRKFISWNDKVSPSKSLSSRNVKPEDLDSIRFEVLLLGKLQLKNEIPQQYNVIDEAVDKYHSLELEHAAAQEELKLAEKLPFLSAPSHDATDNPVSLSQHPLDIPSQRMYPELLHPSSITVWNKDRRPSLDEVRQQRCNSMDITAAAAVARRKSARIRHSSEPSTAATLGFDKNKTRIFQIGKHSITLISSDGSSRNMEICFDIIARFTKGLKYKDHFGVFAKEQGSHFNMHNNHGKEELKFRCYLFKCADECVCEEVMQAIKQACNACVYGLDPMKSYHTLCKRLHSMSGNSSEQAWVEKGKNAATKFIAEIFSEAEQRKVKHKIEECFKAHPPESSYESLVVVMEMIREIYEEKQVEHDLKVKQLHDPQVSSVVAKRFSFFKSRAKKSLTSIESFWGKGLQKMQELHHEAEYHIQSPVERLKFFSENTRSAPSTPSQLHANSNSVGQSNRNRHRSESPASITDVSPLVDSDRSKHILQPEAIRPRSNTLGSPDQGSINVRRKLNMQSSSADPPSSVKISDAAKSSSRSLSPDSASSRSCNSVSIAEKTSPERSPSHTPRKLTIHQKIFSKIATPKAKQSKESNGLKSPSLSDYKRTESLTKTPDQIRSAWQRAINDQIILNKIEKASSNEGSSSPPSPLNERLDYAEPDACSSEMVTVWQELLDTDSRDRYKMDRNILHVAVKKGVPRHLRGKVWSLLYEQWKLRRNERPALLNTFAPPRTSFDKLVKKLTPHQHAILIDLGRTFPSHPYFSQQLGKGQLALFNVLKAYSLIDDTVGYCQGLSFVAGILVMHFNTPSEAFDMLCHVMVDMGCRKLYLPDMAALRVAVYQLSRLLHDFHRDLYEHFETNEVTLMLFTASWFLTMFASVLPFGFTARIFDLLFLEGISALFKTAICLLSHHKESLLKEEGFENVVGYLKSKLVNMGDSETRNILNEIFDLDIGERLRVYEVEYSVLEEGDLFTFEEEENHPENQLKHLELKYTRLEQAHRTVTKYNLELVEQLEAARIQVTSLKQGLADMAGIDEKRTIQLEQLKQENDSLKRNQDAE